MDNWTLFLWGSSYCTKLPGICWKSSFVPGYKTRTVISSKIELHLIMDVRFINGYIKTFRESGLDTVIELRGQHAFQTSFFGDSHKRPCLSRKDLYYSKIEGSSDFKIWGSWHGTLQVSVQLCTYSSAIMHWSWWKVLRTLLVKQHGRVP